MKLLRTVRFDASDDHVFDVAAGAGEWAVSGAFEFVGAPDERLVGKTKQAFVNGFLGLQSFGRATFVTVCDASARERAGAEALLARHFVDVYGAPDMEEAGAAAREEFDFIADLCSEKLVNSVFTVFRELRAGEINEAFREVEAPRERDHACVWDVVDDG